MIVGCGFFSAWVGHTDESRELAQDIAEALTDARIKHDEAWRLMKLSNINQLSRQLAGTEPLNALRLASLPLSFQIAFTKRRAARFGATVITAEERAFICGAASLGWNRFVRLLPSMLFNPKPRESRVA